MRPRSLCCGAVIALVLAVGACVRGSTPAQERPQSPRAGQSDALALDFPGGAVSDLCVAVANELGERVLPRRAYERQIPAFTVPGPAPGNAPAEAPALVPGDDLVALMGGDLDERALRDAVAAYVGVGLKPAWIIEPGAAHSGEDRALSEADVAALPPLPARAHSVEALLGALFAATGVQVLFTDDGQTPAAGFAVGGGGDSLRDAVEDVAQALGARARPVWAAYDLAVDLHEFHPGGTDAAVESAVLRLVNEERARHSAPPLVASRAVIGAARAHSLDMAARGFFNHDNPDGDDPFERAAARGIAYRAYAENIFMAGGWGGTSEGLAESAVRQWMNSAGHRRNILNPEYAETGIGVARAETGASYFTQNFAAPR